MKRSEKDKRYEFVKLCSALTKQGFHFSVLPGYRLEMNIIHLNYKHSLISDFTRTPFVNSFSLSDFTHNSFTVYFNQWSDKYFKL